jgi:hypothetical protein
MGVGSGGPITCNNIRTMRVFSVNARVQSTIYFTYASILYKHISKNEYKRYTECLTSVNARVQSTEEERLLTTYFIV